MKSFSILLVTVSLFAVSCERHEFSETKKLNEPHGSAAAHGDAQSTHVETEEGDVKDGRVLKH